MLQQRSLAASGARLVVALLAAGALGCFAHSRGENDWDEHPVINTGVGATILYPGQSAPTYYPPGTGAPAAGAGAAPPGGSAPSSAVPSQTPAGGPGAGSSATTPAPAPPPSAGSAPSVQTSRGGERRSGSPQAGGTPITMIGGAEQDIDGHLSWKQEPVWEKYLALPFAVIAAPFRALADSRAEAREPGPPIPTTRPPDLGAPGAAGAAPKPEPARPPDYETAMVDRMEQELDERQRRAAQGGAEAASGEAVGAAATANASRLSIADELAALQRRPEADAAAPPAPPSAPPPRARAATPQPATTGAAADGVVDRDHDGRIDEWIYRQNGDIARVELDETGDGHVDRTLHYDLATHQIARVEEDANGDGRVDSWTDYEDGHVARRRGDGNYDGIVDTWSYYDAGVITRHEQDSDGDGFRDRVGFYVAGKLVREDEDRDGDGRPDASIFYDDHERVSRREEDNDRDGRPDVVSYYEDGRLSRREILANDRAEATARP